MKKSVRVFAAAAAALGIGIGMPGNAAKSPIQDLAGRWSGSGTVEWKNGKQDAYQCVVTYFLQDAGASLKQTLRCKSPGDHKLELATLMQVSGEQLVGTWEERMSSMTGDVQGRVTKDGFQALAQNRWFQASFDIAMLGGCAQSITIRPSREIEVISATLKKC
jgi:hypothetical protein